MSGLILLLLLLPAMAAAQDTVSVSGLDPDPVHAPVPEPPVPPAEIDKPVDYEKVLPLPGGPFFKIHRFDLENHVRRKQALAYAEWQRDDVQIKLDVCREERLKDVENTQATGFSLPWYGHAGIWGTVVILVDVLLRAYVL